jgi:benzoyl-CoA reductase subunit D
MSSEKPREKTEASWAAVPETILTCGLDVGARSVKIAILSHRQARPTIVAKVLVRTQGEPHARVERSTIRESWRRVLADAGLSASDIDYVVSTGTCDGEVVGMGRHPERSSHVLGARLLFPDAVAALDVGESEIRCALLSERLGRPYSMARIARGVGTEALAAHPRPPGSTFPKAGESDTTFQSDVARRAVGLVRTLAVEGKIVLTGGMVLDADFIRDIWSGILESGSAVSILISPEAVFAGAYGAAIVAARRFLRLSRAPGPVSDPLTQRVPRIDRRTLN